MDFPIKDPGLQPAGASFGNDEQDNRVYGQTLSKAHSLSQSEKLNSPPLRGVDEGEGKVCVFANDRMNIFQCP
jgi:hypothetical protein